MNIKTHIPGYPRIGKRRELKREIESYWKENTGYSDFHNNVEKLMVSHYKNQKSLDIQTIGDFSLYDHILDTSLLFGNIPRRFKAASFDTIADLQFAVARGMEENGEMIPAAEMRKWFDTNYHYIVPEFSADTEFALNSDLFERKFAPDITESPGMKKAVICGPLTYLWLGKTTGSSPFSRLDLLPRLVEVYSSLFKKLMSSGYSWVQIDEPSAILDYLPAAWQRAYSKTYDEFHSIGLTERPRIMFTTYFDSPIHRKPIFKRIQADGFHFDITAIKTPGAFRRLLNLIQGLLHRPVISLGLISGRNIWKSDLNRAAGIIRRISDGCANEIWISTSSSLIHVPVTLKGEEEFINDGILEKLAFADEKIRELEELKKLLQVHKNSREKTLLQRVPEKVRVPAHGRRGRFSKRASLQKQHLKLPPLPSTTIGSFPQTPEIRKARRDLKSGRITKDQYSEIMKTYIRDVIDIQEQLGLDVLVHGEPERNDMVEYFSEFLEGFISTGNGWVQSYGTRCVKPPIIHADISRRAPMTVDWIRYAASITDKPVKGMLTGPVTLVKWSFPRVDIPIDEQYYQAALAVAGEVRDLEKAGISIIQIDEAAFREAQPLAKRNWKQYSRTASRAFRIASSTASDSTQIHTHMCYSDFSTILHGVRNMDADVLTIETSRSEMTLLETFAKTRGFNQFGPGIYDIHSPAVPPIELLRKRIQRACSYLEPRRLWVNPDCGLKTREWPETEKALEHMMTAVRSAREALACGESV